MSFWTYLTPVQKLGALGVVSLTIFYMATAAITGEGMVDPTLISVFGSMVGIEEARKALKGGEK